MAQQGPAGKKTRLWGASLILAIIGLAVLLYGISSLLRAGDVLADKTPIEVNASRVMWNPNDWNEKKTGELHFITGLHLTSSEPAFGGFSGLHISKDGQTLHAVTDAGHWLAADLSYDGLAVSGLENARMTPIRDTRGRPVESKHYQDAEALDMDENGFACASFERAHRVWCYELGRLGFGAPAIPVEIGSIKNKLASNGGLESLVFLGGHGSGAAPEIFIIAEKPYGETGAMLAAHLSREGIADYSVREHPPFSITDAALRSNGNLLLLERRFSPLAGVGMRMREIPAGFLDETQPLDGRELINVGQTYSIDNMEGLSIVETPEGRTFLFMISDDNFSPIQRTLLLQFELRD